MKWRMIVWGLVLITLGGVVLEPVMELFPQRYFDQLGEMTGTGAFAFVFSVIIAPLLEEGLFRALILRGLNAWWRRFLPAILVSAVLFAFAHLPIWPQVPNAFVGGVVFGYIYLVSGTVWVSIAVHAANNLLAWGMSGIWGDEYVTFRELIACEPAFWALWIACAAVFVLGMKKLHTILREKTLDEGKIR